MKVGVIGSGIAGLTAAWQLSKTQDVVLFERHPLLGMDAHGINIDHEGVQTRVDVPLRVLYENYYPTLLGVYHDLGLEVETVDYAASFSNLGDGPYYRYHNLLIGNLSLPHLFDRANLSATALRILADSARFWLYAPSDLQRGHLKGKTIEDYMRIKGFSEDFATGFLYTAYAGVCTCSLDTVRRYPAEIIVEYLTGGLLLSGVRRVTNGAREVVEKLSESVGEVRCSAAITAVTRSDDGVLVREEDGRESRFDHVVLATQANQAVRLLADADDNERRILAAFPYEKSEVVMHTDPALAPKRRKHWAPVNFITGQAADKPMATILMNLVQPDLHGTSPIFQTWNPLVEPHPDKVLSRVTFERPTVDIACMQAVRDLNQLHDTPNRNVWFCGSYAGFGIPLLESAARTALSVAQRISG